MEAMAARVWVERKVEKGKTTCQVEEERVGEEKGDVREQEVQREIEIGQSRAWDRCPRGKKGGKQFSREHGKEEDATRFRPTHHQRRPRSPDQMDGPDRKDRHKGESPEEESK